MQAAPRQKLIDLRLPAVPASVSRLRHAAVRVAREQDLPDPYAVGLAVTEAATNAVLHAYRGDDAPHQEVRLVMCAEPDRVVIVVRDWGDGMRPRTDSPGAGLGLTTMAYLSQFLRVETPDVRGTLLRMHFAREATSAVAA